MIPLLSLTQFHILVRTSSPFLKDRDFLALPEQRRAIVSPILFNGPQTQLMITWSADFLTSESRGLGVSDPEAHPKITLKVERRE